MATNNEIYRTQYLLNEVGLKDLFDYVFSSSEVGFLKSAGEFWKFVQERIGVNDPGNIVVWDSDRKNIKKVNELGMKGFIFTDEETFLMDINEMLDPKKMEHDKRKIA